jgi:NAD(P)H-dependent FMN reductase
MGLIIVAPEYNHGYPGMLKHALDSNLKEYIHKPVGLCGVSAGGFGGTRVVESLLPVMRELGLVSIFWDVNVSSVGKVFDDSGRLVDDALLRRLKKFLDELVWTARVLRAGRDEMALNSAPALTCTMCGAQTWQRLAYRHLPTQCRKALVVPSARSRALPT